MIFPRQLSGKVRKGQQRRRHQYKEKRHGQKQNRQRPFVRGFAAFRAFHHGNHAVKKTVPGVARDAYDDPIGQNRRTARHSALVAPLTAHDGRGFPRHRGFVDGGNAAHHFAVRGDHFACEHQNQIALPKFSAVHRFPDGFRRNAVEVAFFKAPARHIVSEVS